VQLPNEVCKASGYFSLVAPHTCKSNIPNCVCSVAVPVIVAEVITPPPKTLKSNKAQGLLRRLNLSATVPLLSFQTHWDVNNAFDGVWMGLGQSRLFTADLKLNLEYSQSWNNQAKPTSTWVDETKPTSSWVDETKPTSTWTDIAKTELLNGTKLLLENGSYLLLESSDKLLLESSDGGDTWTPVDKSSATWTNISKS